MQFFRTMTHADQSLVRRRLRLNIIFTILLSLPALMMAVSLFPELGVNIASLIEISLVCILLVPSLMGIWRVKNLRLDLKHGQVLVTQGAIQSTEIDVEYGSKIIVDGRPFLPLPLERRKDSVPLLVGTNILVEELPASGLVLRIRVT